MLHDIEGVVRPFCVVLEEENGVLAAILRYFHLRQCRLSEIPVTEIARHDLVVHALLKALNAKQVRLG